MRRIAGVGIVCVLAGATPVGKLAGAESPGPSSPPARERFVGWEGSTALGAGGLGGDRWGIPELWWYQRARAFAVGARIEVDCPDATGFVMRGQALPGSKEAYFGVAAQWGTPLSQGYKYRFCLIMTNPSALPDFIAVNGQIIWRSAQGYADPQRHKVFCEYIPAKDREEVELWLVRKASSQWAKLLPPHQGIWDPEMLICHRAAWSGVRPDYPSFVVPKDVTFLGANPNLACTDHHVPYYTEPVSYRRPPWPQLPYRPAELTVVEQIIPPEAGAHFSRELGVHYSFLKWPKADSFERKADAAIAAGLKNVALPPLIEMRDYDPKAPAGLVFPRYLHGVMTGRNPYRRESPAVAPEARQALLDHTTSVTAAAARYWLEKVPDGKVMIWHQEISGAFSPYGAGVEGSWVGQVAGNEIVAQGGRTAWQKSFDWFRSYHERLLAAVGPELASRVSVGASYDRAGFQGAYAYRSGLEVTMLKNIHRQSINVVAANARGAGRTYGKPYGCEFDSWDRCFWGSYHPDELRPGLLVYFHAGSQYLMDEIPCWNHASHSLTAWGAAWLDALRYMRTHPRLGAQQVRIAVMRALGDDWNRMAGPSSGWEAGSWLPTNTIRRQIRRDDTPWLWSQAKLVAGQPPALNMIRTKHTYLADYDLLDLVFARFGNAGRTEANRLCTGTPYGPIDFIPWDTPLVHLKTYDVIVCLGRGVGTDRETTERLKAYVREGGTLVLAAGQLRDDDDRFACDEFLGVSLGTTESIDGVPSTSLSPPPGAEILATSGGQRKPSLLRLFAERGQVLLSSGEWLSAGDPGPMRKALSKLFESARWVTFAPESTWIEYMVQRKGDTYVLPFFHHGRGLYPSKNGEDNGVWKGTVHVDLHKLGLAGREVDVFRSVYRPNAAPPYELQPLPFTIQGSGLSVSLNITDLTELVIGPRDEAKAAFFR
jgi:hypothetical protein